MGEPPLEFRGARLGVDLRETRTQRLHVGTALFHFGDRDLAPQLALLAMHRLELLEDLDEFPAFGSDRRNGSRRKKEGERGATRNHA